MIFILLPLPPQRFKYRHRRFNPFLTSFYQICYCQFITLGYNKVLLNTICKSWLNRLDAKLFAVRAPSFCDLPSELFYRHLGFLLIPISTWPPHVPMSPSWACGGFEFKEILPTCLAYRAADAHPVCVSRTWWSSSGLRITLTAGGARVKLLGDGPHDDMKVN